MKKLITLVLTTFVSLSAFAQDPAQEMNVFPLPCMVTYDQKGWDSCDGKPWVIYIYTVNNKGELIRKHLNRSCMKSEEKANLLYSEARSNGLCK